MGYMIKMNYLTTLPFQEVFLVCLTMNFSFFLTCFWIYKNEMSGKWEKYRIRIQQTNQPVDLQKRRSHYHSQLPWVCFFLFVLKPITLLLAHNYVFAEKTNIIKDVFKTLLAFVFAKIWHFCVHMGMHKTKLMKYHKDHHLPLDKLTCISTFTNSALEFIIVDGMQFVFGMSVVGGLPILYSALLGTYDYVFGAIDHSGFCLDTYWFNSIYHFVHHIEVDMNYGQLSLLDTLNGTYKQYDLKDVVEAFKATKNQKQTPLPPNTTQ